MRRSLYDRLTKPGVTKNKKKTSMPGVTGKLIGGRDVLILEGMDSHTNVHRARWVGGLCSKKTT